MSSVTNQLWELLPHPSPEHVVRMFARDAYRRIGDFARNPLEMDRFIRSAEGCNVYVAPNPTKCTTGIRHTAADVTHWSYIFLDIDPVEDDYEPDAALEIYLHRMGEWLGKDLVKTKPLIIDSGRGRQAWIRLEDIHLYENVTGYDSDKIQKDGMNLVTARKSARKIMSFWLKRLSDMVGTVHGCRLDTTVSDLPRVMRMPGTINLKTGNTAEILVPSQRVYTGAAQLLAVGVPEAVYLEIEPGQYPVGTPWQVAFPTLTRKAQDYLTKGKVKPGRHETAWHTCKKLQEAGIGKAQARAAIGFANSIMGEEHALSPKDLDHAVETAFKP